MRCCLALLSPKAPCGLPACPQAVSSRSREDRLRTIKTVDLQVRPIHHRAADRVRCHGFLCMLAYYVEWHMRSVLKPVLFDNEENPVIRPDPVSSKKPSAPAKAKALKKQIPDGLPMHSFQSLLGDLATIVRNTIVPAIAGDPRMNSTHRNDTSADQNPHPSRVPTGPSPGSGKFQ